MSIQLADIPRVKLAHLPTPLEPLPRLSRHLGGPQIYIKRDDCTGLALGGNKVRKLEYLLAEAMAAGADTLITEGGVQSNHCRQTAAAAARTGLKCELVLKRVVDWNDPSYEETGNIQLDHLFGAKLHFIERETDGTATMQARAELIRAAGGKPWIIPIGGSTPTGALGYVRCGLEMLRQADEQGIRIDHIVHTTGSCGTQAGLLAAMLASSSGIQVTGISVSSPSAELAPIARELTLAVLDRLRIKATLPAAVLVIEDGYVGTAYGQPTPGMVEALELAATHEGLVFDPVYTGKALAGLIDLIRRGRFAPSETVVFIHTGGIPALFAYRTAFGPA
jgi:L-cysteate sulfo-lyase